MTTKQMEQIEKLNKEGLNDQAIADELGLSRCTVTYWRKEMGLKPVRKMRVALRKQYEVYDGKTAAHIVTGTATQCALELGISEGHFFKVRKMFEEGTYTKYEIYEVAEA